MVLPKQRDVNKAEGNQSVGETEDMEENQMALWKTYLGWTLNTQTLNFSILKLDFKSIFIALATGAGLHP